MVRLISGLYWRDVKLLIFSGLEKLKRDSMVRRFKKWGPGFNLKFDIKVKKVTNKWHNLLHFTTEEDSSRVPGLWLNSQNGKPIIQLSVDNTALIGKIKDKLEDMEVSLSHFLL